MSTRRNQRDSVAGLAECLAHLLGVAAAAVPVDDAERTAWLAGKGLALVPVAAPQSFGWPGPWIALRASPDQEVAQAVVVFGAPSGILYPPAASRGEILAGFVVAPFDMARWRPVESDEASAGTIAAILLAPETTAHAQAVSSAEAIEGKGLLGDRYARGQGTFPSGRPGSALTLIEAEVLDRIQDTRDGAVIEHRRNIVTRGVNLNALVGRIFALGDEVICEGRRLCEPCAHLDELNGGGLLRPLVHRGGLRADIIAGGAIRVGDALSPITAPIAAEGRQ